MARKVSRKKDITSADESLKKLNLRLTKELFRRLETAAKESERSVNGEIVWRLRMSVNQVKVV